jgi:hypothetical protein
MLESDSLQIYYDDVVSDESWKDQLFDYNIGGELIYKGANTVHDADIEATTWAVWKFTYVGGDVTRIEGPLIGSWDGRTALAWGV